MEKFDMDELFRKYGTRVIAVHTPTKVASQVFMMYLSYIGETWCSGRNFEVDDEQPWDRYKEQLCYALDDMSYGSVDCYAKEWDYQFVEFDDFDWTDFLMMCSNKLVEEQNDKSDEEETPSIKTPGNNINDHWNLCTEIHELYTRKNADYGDSFHTTYIEEGMAMPRIRLSDKLQRFKTLSKLERNPMVTDESIIDTLLDLANYSLMTIMEVEREREEKGNAVN